MCTSKHRIIWDGFEFESFLDSQNGTNVNYSLWNLNSTYSNHSASANFLESISMPITITNLVCHMFDDTIPRLVEGDLCLYHMLISYQLMKMITTKLCMISYVWVGKMKFGQRTNSTHGKLVRNLINLYKLKKCHFKNLQKCHFIFVTCFAKAMVIDILATT